MVVIVDACSLLELSRYYISFDDKQVLLSFIQSKFDSKEIVLLDKILEECKFVANGLAVASLPFIQEKKYITKTNDLVIHSPKKFQNLLDNQFCIQIARRGLDDVKYLQYKNEYLETGDAKIIIYIEDLLHNGCNTKDIVLVTEETRSQNDGKIFKKLPLICDAMGIKTMNIVEYLKSNNVVIDWVVPERK